MIKIVMIKNLSSASRDLGIFEIGDFNPDDQDHDIYSFSEELMKDHSYLENVVMNSQPLEVIPAIDLDEGRRMAQEKARTDGYFVANPK